ncbi:uncharacterized protein LOC128380434 [Scomber scombrus]|uniref:Uncharacterized protein LOC128380434 n=1 Tax=Scomber scombrus TaxID=13677 RepID=A0AAV1Q2E4_SCOSC
MCITSVQAVSWPKIPAVLKDPHRPSKDFSTSANSRVENYHLLKEISNIQMEVSRIKTALLQLQRLIPTRTGKSRPSLDPNTKFNQSVDQTEVSAEQFTLIHLCYSISSLLAQPTMPLQSTSDDSYLRFDSNTNMMFDLSADKEVMMPSEWFPPALSPGPSCFTPELLHEPGHISYRFSCPGPGVFQCIMTKLIFTMDREGELLYKTVQWDENLIQSAGKRPAGPLFDIKCSEEAVSKLHLRHCEKQPASLSDLMSVVHITDNGMSLLEPLEITDTHVVVDVPHLSRWGLVWDIKRFFSPDPKPICGQVLMFHRPTYKGQRPKLNVFLLPENVLVQEVKEQQEKAEYIDVPSSCDLIEGQTYSLQCSEVYKVQPPCARFNLKYGPNYHKTFEIRLTPSTDDVTVTVHDQEKKQVWEYDVELPGKEGIALLFIHFSFTQWKIQDCFYSYHSSVGLH